MDRFKRGQLFYNNEISRRAEERAPRQILLPSTIGKTSATANSRVPRSPRERPSIKSTAEPSRRSRNKEPNDRYRHLGNATLQLFPANFSAILNALAILHCQDLTAATRLAAHNYMKKFHKFRDLTLFLAEHRSSLIGRLFVSLSRSVSKDCA